jgi:hypothetical protein
MFFCLCRFTGYRPYKCMAPRLVNLLHPLNRMLGRIESSPGKKNTSYIYKKYLHQEKTKSGRVYTMVFTSSSLKQQEQQ